MRWKAWPKFSLNIPKKIQKECFISTLYRLALRRLFGDIFVIIQRVSILASPNLL